MHALLYGGTYEWALTCLPNEYRVEGADVLHYHGDRMGIDDARALIGEAYKTPLTREDRVFILAYAAYTGDAQNALLKLLEEPPRTARFYVVAERPHLLLPTLRSRLIQGESEEVGVSTYDHRDFTRLTYGERLAVIGERAKAKNEAWLTSLMEHIERVAEERKDPALMRSVLELKPHFHMSGASRKMILEHLTLML